MNTSLRLIHALLFLTFLGLASEALAAGPTEKILYSFSGPDGSTPEAGMSFDSAGNLYGTTYWGGNPKACFSGGCGTIFALSPHADGTWSEAVLHSFDVTHGAYPDQNLIFDSAGNLYAVTDVGGGEVGGVFELMRAGSGWHYKVIHRFRDSKHDGGSPRSILLRDPHGNLFGTTAGGGTGGNGTVYELSPDGGGSWKESILLNFGGGYAPPGGAEPQAGFIQDADGNLYGTTSFGGNSACPQGCGTVFELSPNGDGTWMKRILHKFDGTDGNMPVADLVADAAGNLVRDRHRRRNVWVLRGLRNDL